MPVPSDFTVPEPWFLLDPLKDVAAIQRFATELLRELSREHALYGIKAIPRAARVDRDEVLFELTGADASLAIVHLTFKRDVENDPRWPMTRFLKSWDAFRAEAERAAQS